MTKNAAFERQVQASDPTATTWLSANAGSGKTRVLTDRVARLLLGEVQPQHILCLTYTKAAASEMQNRLFLRLGEWAMKSDADLHKALAELGDEGRHKPGALAKARQLFARAIETPGGLRIQTIHSFCASLLRRFPLESGVSPHFTELDDRAATLMRATIIEEMAETRAPEIIAEVAHFYSGEDFSDLLKNVVTNRSLFAKPLDVTELKAQFDLQPHETEQSVLDAVFLGGEADLFSGMAPLLNAGLKTDQKLAKELAALDLLPNHGAKLAILEGVLLFGSDKKLKKPNCAKIGDLPTKDTRSKLNAGQLRAFEDLMARVEVARPKRLALQAVAKTITLHRFAAAFLPIYTAAKASRGWLDFDDLITRAKNLLTNRDVAAWVLFRLDGGIDHVLVDEAQDTSPDQWRVIELLTEEFTSGDPSRHRPRTLFVVGDKKQSIYSFQGADVAAFDEKHDRFKQKFEMVGLQFQSLKLEHSFRSSPAILRFVDETFGKRFPQAMGGDVNHAAFKDQMPGRVDLWPLIEPVKSEESNHWEDPVDLIAETHHAARLAKSIAAEIKGMIKAGVQIPLGNADDPALSRPVHAGDFLILVQRRSELFGEIIRACKKAGLPIAGADRLKLGAELAVKDLAALLAFLATPDDDLALATALRSPLFGWTEAELYDVAQGRSGFLWEALRNRVDHPETLEILTDLRNQSDFLRPFDLLERAMTRHDGRRRLLARLGPEAEDGIDELLTQALAYERAEVPSLTGFQIWLKTDDIEVKRQMDSEGQRIRVMTVHGAKGLEAPIVILPDTADRNSKDNADIYKLSETLPVWRTNVESSPAAITTARHALHIKAEQESLRLLYVALTRARAWLIIAGAGAVKSEAAWHVLCAQGMDAAGGTPTVGGRVRFSYGQWPENLQPSDPATITSVMLPAWATQAADPMLRPEQTRSPSNLGGAKALPGESDDFDGFDSKARGVALHLLLEHLPQFAQDTWPNAAANLIKDDELLAAVYSEAVAVLTKPSLAQIFAPNTLAEVPVTAALNGFRLFGSIDRLIVTDTAVLAVDYKSNQLVPTPHNVPEGLLRQLGAYTEALRQIYPNKSISAAILWTRTASLMVLDPEILRSAVLRATIDGGLGLDVASVDP